MVSPTENTSAMTTTVATKPYLDQKPGTSGLRKKVQVFQQENYLANFIQSIFDSLPKSELTGSTILVSGDGRYFSEQAIHIITEIAAGNGVRRVWVGVNGICSTPAASAIIREREGGVCYGGIILTASHNPGGPTEDFGVKYNTSNGGPALEHLTDAIYARSKEITEFRKINLPAFDYSKPAVHDLIPGAFQVEVIDAIEDWMRLMKQIFDFEAIKHLISRRDFSFVYDGLSGAAGPYARALFVNELGAGESALINCTPLPDFGGHHPDPNLTYAKDLVNRMKVLEPEAITDETPDFGAAGDGDNDRNMILGKGFFVTPSDSVAAIAAYAEACIPYFKKNGISGLSRSMPTSRALDAVAAKKNVPLYEVPTGWKYFGNLMDAGKISICGEESFGTGSNHIREKDGLWAVLCWLSILAHKNRDAAKPLISVKAVMEEFWAEYGRIFYTRYDYENIDSDKAAKVMDRMRKYVGPIDYRQPVPSAFIHLHTGQGVKCIRSFDYTDPVDKSVSPNQGIIVEITDGGRCIWRTSGTGSTGTTIRIYVEVPSTLIDDDNAQATRMLVQFALDLCEIEAFTGRAEPTVIT